MGRLGHREDKTSEISKFRFPPPKHAPLKSPLKFPLLFPFTTNILTDACAGTAVAIDIVTAAAAAYTDSFFICYLLFVNAIPQLCNNTIFFLFSLPVPIITQFLQFCYKIILTYRRWKFYRKPLERAPEITRAHMRITFQLLTACNVQGLSELLQ